MTYGCCCCLIAQLSDSFGIPGTVTHQAPLSKGFPSQEHWSGLPFLSPGDLPQPGIELMSPALAGRFFTCEPPGKPYVETLTLKVTVLGGGALSR